MIARLIATALFVITAATLFTGTATTPSIAGVICKEKGFRGNSNKFSALPIDLETKARMAWGNYCEKIYSKVWCSSHLAKNKRMICNGGICEFEATPCRNN